MRRFTSFYLVVLLFFQISIQAQPVLDVFKSFRKLEADTEAGVNFNEYARALAEVNAQLKNFTDANPGKPPASVEALRSAFELYRKARALWDEQNLQDMRYQNGDLSLQAYFNAKEVNKDQIRSIWKQAGQEVDRAATLTVSKQRPKEKRTN